jgi:excisionase family DNA binding protein
MNVHERKGTDTEMAKSGRVEGEGWRMASYETEVGYPWKVEVPVGVRTGFYTVDEMAVILRFSPRTIREWLRNGRLEGVRCGRIWRIPVEEGRRCRGVEEG